MSVLFLAAEKHRATFIAPIGIGLAMFVIELAGVLYTGGSVLLRHDPSSFLRVEG